MSKSPPRAEEDLTPQKAKTKNETAIGHLRASQKINYTYTTTAEQQQLALNSTGYSGRPSPHPYRTLTPEEW
jgi:hypothetical protein